MKKISLRHLVYLSAIVMNFFAHASLPETAEEMSYRLLCETKTKRFILEIADKNISTGLASLIIYDRVGETGTIYKATTSVNLDATWGENRDGRYISSFSYRVGSVIQVNLRRTRGGSCENLMLGGTRYRAQINSHQPMLEFKNSRLECESTRIHIGLQSGGGGTSV